MFELNVNKGEIVEDREFLLKEPVAAAPVSSLDSKQLMSRVPDDAPYYKIEPQAPEGMSAALASVLSLKSWGNDAASSYRGGRYIDMNYDEDSGSDKFEKDIDETDDETASVSATDEKSVDLASPLTLTGPRAILTLARSRAEPAPLFVEFDRAAVVTLSSPVAFDRLGFEKTLSDALTSGLLFVARSSMLNGSRKRARVSHGERLRSRRWVGMCNMPFKGTNLSYRMSPSFYRKCSRRTAGP